ncbi:hypothetical protein [Neobacillus citreus]|uniref:Uncharacterized protein n=1 Tax=Neobacillus citreus TaxID=2833578 RepID=A0A942T6U9_9BACI|nr:hypothetical protein [Neobacillus citreus]MCH6269205.1 hypothetical protein [Neobacillus citreus]
MIPINKKNQTSDKSGIEQPLMSTGTTEAGFDWKTDKPDEAAKPKIGNQSIGEQAGSAD